MTLTTKTAQRLKELKAKLSNWEKLFRNKCVDEYWRWHGAQPKDSIKTPENEWVAKKVEYYKLIDKVYLTISSKKNELIFVKNELKEIYDRSGMGQKWNGTEVEWD